MDKCSVKDKNACNVPFGKSVRETRIGRWSIDAGTGATGDFGDWNAEN